VGHEAYKKLAALLSRQADIKNRLLSAGEEEGPKGLLRRK
jgi:hypothetical protein